MKFCIVIMATCITYYMFLKGGMLYNESNPIDFNFMCSNPLWSCLSMHIKAGVICSFSLSCLFSPATPCYVLNALRKTHVLR